jgi:cytochrome c
MHRRYFLGFAAAVLAGTTRAGATDTHGTREQAVAMVEKAAALISTQGKNKAFTVIDDPTGPFVDGDLYVFVTGIDSGVTLAHGVNKALIGKSLLHLKDADGKLFVQAMIDVAQSKGEGWVDYKWPNPVTRKIEAKTSFVKKVGDVLVGCGVYQN